MIDNPGLCLEWRNLNYSVQKDHQSYSLWNQCKKQSKIDILKDVNGQIESGDLVAILGCSGSGKTSLLAAISQRLRGELTGDIVINGRAIDRDEMTKLSSFLPQFEISVRSFTAFEHLFFMTHFKMDKYTTQSDKRQHVYNLLFTVGLKDSLNTQIRHLSGGERKRLSLAEELITNPPFLFCDEPTTGLDSFSALSVIRTLRRLCTKNIFYKSSATYLALDSKQEQSTDIEMEIIPSNDNSLLKNSNASSVVAYNFRKAIICSIHQPTSDIFELFTHIILMDSGRIIYQGSTDEAYLFFSRLGFTCPKNTNPSDFYLKLVSDSQHQKSVGDYIHNKFEAERLESTNTSSWLQRRTSIYENYRQSSVLKKISWFYQVYLLISRLTTEDTRNIKEAVVALGYFMITSVTIAALYSNVKEFNQLSIQDISGSLFMLTTEIIFTFSYGVIFMIPSKLPIIRREAGEGTYSLSAIYVATYLSLLPSAFLKTYLFFGLVYITFSFTQGIVLYLLMGLVLSLSSATAIAYGIFVSSIFESDRLSSEMAAPLDLLFLIFGGLYFNVDTIPILKYISLFFYSNEALMFEFWKDIDGIQCYNNQNLPCLKTGLEVLERRSFNTHPSTLLYDCIGLICLAISFNFFAFMFIKRYVRRSGYY